MVGLGAATATVRVEGVGFVDRSKDGVGAATTEVRLEAVVGVRPASLCSGSPRKEPALTPATCRAWNWCIHKLKEWVDKKCRQIK